MTPELQKSLSTFAENQKKMAEAMQKALQPRIEANRKFIEACKAHFF